MKKISILTLTVVIITSAYFIAKAYKGTCPLAKLRAEQRSAEIRKSESKNQEGMLLLRLRKNKEALAIFNEVLAKDPGNIEALWGKGEFLRRNYRFKEAEETFNKTLQLKPGYLSALNSLAYIKYQQGNLNESLKMVNEILQNKEIDNENQAHAYLLIGGINGTLTDQGGIFAKMKYGTQIKPYFERARDIAPELPETHVALGTFYLKAPGIAGGDLKKALFELEQAVKMAPDYATANARLAQAYKKTGKADKYNFYIQKAKNLDPKDEALLND